MANPQLPHLQRRLYTGSFRALVPLAAPNTIVLSDDAFGRASLYIKNTSASLCWIAFGQSDAEGLGYPLEPNDSVSFPYPDNCPVDRVVATAESADVTLAIIVVRYSQH